MPNPRCCIETGLVDLAVGACEPSARAPGDHTAVPDMERARAHSGGMKAAGR